MIACPCEVCQSTDPRDNRLRSSIMVESETTTLVVDSTPDFRYQMLRAKVKKLDGIVYTHPHKDHIAGLDDVRAFNYFSQKPMQIYANEMTQMNIIREFPYAFAESKYPGVVVGDISITPILVWHLRMPVLGFRFGNFTYITDANRIDEPELEKIKGSTHLVLNALRHEKHISHFTLGEAIEMVQKLEVPNAWFTHISHQLGLHSVVDATLPKGMHLAYDGLRIQI
jgi:phosphoribosyl 1,2-cyclic phosphate phosphodiesterase